MSGVYSSIVSAGEGLNLGHVGTRVINTLRMEKGFRGWDNLQYHCMYCLYSFGEFIKMPNIFVCVISHVRLKVGSRDEQRHLSDRNWAYAFC